VSDDVIFEELPPDGRESAAGWKAALMKRPGEWARLPLATTNTGHNKLLGFEVVARTVDGERRIYGRYVGTNGNTP